MSTTARVHASSCRIVHSPAPDSSACPPAAGCGHCKRLVPEYTKLGEKIASDPKLKNRVLIAKVDADAHRELGARHFSSFLLLHLVSFPVCLVSLGPVKAPEPPDTECCNVVELLVGAA